MIRMPEEIPAKAKKIRMLIAGAPGVGKSTLGLSAPNALHIDVDCGIERIEPMYRRPFIQPKNYEEVLTDLVPSNLDAFDSLVFDTGGKLLDLMKPWAIKRDAKNGKRDGSLSLQGYGAVSREFNRLMDYCYYELDKNVIVLFHSIEEKDGDNVRLRLMVEGSTKNSVWIPMDLGGFMEVIGENRTLGLSCCERYYAKGTRGINGVINIPVLTRGKPNDFLANLFDQYAQKSIEDAKILADEQGKYRVAMGRGVEILNGVVDADSANMSMSQFKMIQHGLTSKRELTAMWNRKMAELGLNYSKDAQCYLKGGAV